MTRQRHSQGNEDAGLGRRVAAAAGWMVAFRWIDRLIGLASVAILARILIPEDFGIVAYAMLVIGILELFTGISTDAELIRHKDADRAYYDAAWTMNILRGLAVGSLMLALLPPAVHFFREPRLAAIMLALAAIPVIQGFENIGIIDFRKYLEFDREFRFLLVSRILGTAATIALAFALRNYWALVAGSILRAGFRVALSYGFHAYRPRLALAQMPQIFRFSRWMMLQNLASGVNEKLPALVIGREWGTSPLAFFNIAQEIANLSTTEIRAPIRRALYPGLAQVVERREQLRKVLVESTGMLALLTAPIPLGIALVAEDLVPVFLGTQWQPTVEVLQPLCIAASVAALGTNSQLAYMALNRSYLTAFAALIRLLLLLALLALLAPSHGAIGVAYAVMTASCIMLVADYVLSARILGIGVSRFLAAVWRPVIATLVMCASVWLVRAGFAPASDPAGHIWSIVRSALPGAVVYVTCVLALWTVGGRQQGAETRLIALVKNYRSRHGRMA